MKIRSIELSRAGAEIVIVVAGILIAFGLDSVGTKAMAEAVLANL